MERKPLKAADCCFHLATTLLTQFLSSIDEAQQKLAFKHYLRAVLAATLASMSSTNTTNYTPDKTIW